MKTFAIALVLSVCLLRCGGAFLWETSSGQTASRQPPPEKNGSSTSPDQTGADNASDYSPAVVIAPSNTAKPSVTGVAQTGQVLSAADGTWAGTAPLSFQREWERCTSVSSCAP